MQQRNNDNRGPEVSAEAVFEEERGNDQEERRSSRRGRDESQSRSARDDGPLLRGSLESGDLSRLVELGREQLRNNADVVNRGKTLEWKIIPVTGNQVSMELDAVIVAARHISTDEVYATALIFQGTRTMPKQPVYISRDVTAKFTTIANDQYTSEGYLDAVNDVIAKESSGWASSNITHVGSFAILTEKNTDKRLADIVTSAVNAVDYYIKQVNDTNGLSIADLNLKENDLVANVVFHSGDYADQITDLPHRNDISIELRPVRQTDNARREVNVLSVTNDTKLADISAFVDLTYTGPENKPRRGTFSRKKDEDIDTRIYGTRVVITAMKHVPTLEHMLLTLAQLPVLTENAVVETGLRPQGVKSLRTAEALTFELEAKVESFPEVLNDEEWADLCYSVLREDNISIQLQIPRSGLSNAVHSVLVSACDRDNKEHIYAARTLLNSADILSGDLFSEGFSKEENALDIGELLEMPALLGTWVDVEGRIRDLREIGYYEILTAYGKTDPTIVTDFDTCLHDDRVPYQWRLDRYEEIIMQYTGNSAKILDRADVIELNLEGWLYPLTDACRLAGMVVSTDGIRKDTSAYERGHASTYAGRGYGGTAFRNRSRGRGYGFGGR